MEKESCSCPGNAVDCDRHCELTERQGADCPPKPLENEALLTPEFLTSGLRNDERRNFCCFKPSGLWHFVLAALGNCATHELIKKIN